MRSPVCDGRCLRAKVCTKCLNKRRTQADQRSARADKREKQAAAAVRATQPRDPGQRGAGKRRRRRLRDGGRRGTLSSIPGHQGASWRRLSAQPSAPRRPQPCADERARTGQKAGSSRTRVRAAHLPSARAMAAISAWRASMAKIRPYNTNVL